MSQRYSDRLTRVLSLANKEAMRLGHERISPEHALLGFLQEGSGVGINILKSLDLNLPAMQGELLELVRDLPRGSGNTGGDESQAQPQDTRFKDVLESAMQEAGNLNHNYVGTEHLILGLLCHPNAPAAKLLMKHGASLERFRVEMVDLLGMAVPSADDALASPQEHIRRAIEELLEARRWLRIQGDATRAAALEKMVDQLLTILTQLIRVM